jgi:transposase
MSAAFTKAKLVYDNFHVVKLYNEKLSDLRRELYRTTEDADEKKLFYGFRDREYLKLRICDLQETNFKMVI